MTGTTVSVGSLTDPTPGGNKHDNDTRPRLAVLTDAVHPWHTGGKETRQHELLPRLVQRGFAVDVYTMKWWPQDGDLHLNGVTYRAICPHLPLYRGHRRSILQAVVFSASALRMVTKRFDVLEADMVPVLHLFPAKLATLLTRRPLAVTWHEYWGRTYWIAYLGRLGHVAAALEALAVRLPDAVVAASDGTAERVRDAFGSRAREVYSVPNGVDVEAIRTARASALAENGTAGTGSLPRADLVVVGRLLAHKNVDVAIRALRRLHDEGQARTMLVIGEGPERRSLEQLARHLDLEEAVTFAGTTQEHEHVLLAMARARALVFCSVREGFGMVALEAMALGTPVVTSDHPDNFARHLVRSGVDGEVCPPEPEQVATAIRTILTDPQRRSDAAMQGAENFTWDSLADRAAGVYAALATGARHKGGAR